MGSFGHFTGKNWKEKNESWKRGNERFDSFWVLRDF